MNGSHCLFASMSSEQGLFIWYDALMQTPARDANLNRALEVFRLANEGMSVVDVTAKVGLPRSTLYYLYKKHPEVFEEVQNAIRGEKLVQLAQYVGKQTAVLDRLLEKATADNVKASGLIKILDSMDRRIKELLAELDPGGERSAHNSPAEQYLQGPKLRREQSTFQLQNPNEEDDEY
jgi:AcrR family transcriptional regulator